MPNFIKSSKFRRFAKSLLEIIETLTIVIAAVLIIRTYVVQPFLVDGSSMESTFHDGDYLLIDEIIYRFRKPQRGEVIVFKRNSSNTPFFIKRIIGLPSEQIIIKKGRVDIYAGDDKIEIQENYIKSAGTFGDTNITLENNEYFVMGDNRNLSSDSRRWGPLKEEEITGLVRFRLWPIGQVQAFNAPTY